MPQGAPRDWAPPHTRGSTPWTSPSGWCCSGSPAHAGIDQNRDALQRARSRLPRTRGDRPSCIPPTPASRAAPPHTRGSTREAQDLAAEREGSPAHAGIDPARSARPSRPWWLPRTRGDRPAPRGLRVCGGLAPPHTRGSTARESPALSQRLGSPAHAGIDPRWSNSSVKCSRLPRTRGDRPAASIAAADGALAPPHTRGSTVRQELWSCRVDGSPAHAGIDPWHGNWGSLTLGLPRTRGDRPRHSCGAAIPRRAPPHTRGSTQFREVVRRVHRGSPAHAGIDPSSGRPFAVPYRLPRTRGDRPAASSSSRVIRPAPPHTRGSTRSFPRP